jgi:hypothetical protein
LINIYRIPVSGVFRHKDLRFAVCGENLASISQFVAGKRHAPEHYHYEECIGAKKHLVLGVLSHTGLWIHWWKRPSGDGDAMSAEIVSPVSGK